MLRESRYLSQLHLGYYFLNNCCHYGNGASRWNRLPLDDTLQALWLRRLPLRWTFWKRRRNILYHFKSKLTFDRIKIRSWQWDAVLNSHSIDTYTMLLFHLIGVLQLCQNHWYRCFSIQRANISIRACGWMPVTMFPYWPPKEMGIWI